MARKQRDDDAPDASPDQANGSVPAVPGDDRAVPALESGGRAAPADESLVDASVELPRFVQPAHALSRAESDDLPSDESDGTTERSARRSSKANAPESEWAPLISGDPLLTGRTPVVRGESRPTESASQSPADSPPQSAARSSVDAPAESPLESSRPAAPPAAPSAPPGVQRSAGPPAAPSGERRDPSAAPPPPPRRDPAPPRQRATVPPAPAAAPTGPPTGAIGGVVVPGGASDPSGRTARRAARGASLTEQQRARPVARPVDPSGPTATLRPTTVAPVPRIAGRRPRVRRVTRVVRHVDPWSVFKVAAVFSLIAYVIVMVAGMLLWNVAYSTGTIDNIERGMESTGWSVFELEGGEIFHNAWIGGLFLAVGMTGLAVLVATLFNLITDLVGGIRFTVLEEEVIEKTASPMRRFSTRRDEPAGPRQ